MRNLLTSSVAAAALLVGISGAASAATVSYSSTTGPSYTPAGSFPTSINIQKFDTSLGSLTAATLTLSITELASILVTNNFGSPRTLSSATANTNFNVSLTSPALSVTTTASASITGPITLATGNTLFTGIAASSSNALNLDATQRAAFSGAGVANIALTIGSPIITTAGGASDGDLLVSFAGGAQAIMTLAIEYTYTVPTNDVPEPATLALLGMSVAGIAAMRRRRANG